MNSEAKERSGGDGAIMSGCGQYRYLLSRDISTIGDAGKTVFVMLNPSTADAVQDDPTVRRCISFAELWGSSGLIVANLYALRSTDPKALWQHCDPVGPENDGILRGLAHKHRDIVCAWGVNAKPDRVRRFYDFMVSYGANMLCLGTTKSGAPRHPLYLKRNAALVPWSPIC
jgi:hypothetical protein